MPSFSSIYEVELQKPLQDAFDGLSSEAAFKDFIKLSPTTHTIEIIDIEKPKLNLDYITKMLQHREKNALYSTFGLYPQPEAKGPLSEQATGEYETIRYRFKLVERFRMMGGVYKQDVEIFGSQIVIPELHLHLYETSANRGLVLVTKSRQFSADGERTKISELIRGETNILLRKYTEVSCRKAHADHMENYHTLL